MGITLLFQAISAKQMYADAPDALDQKNRRFAQNRLGVERLLRNDLSPSSVYNHAQTARAAQNVFKKAPCASVKPSLVQFKIFATGSII